MKTVIIVSKCLRISKVKCHFHFRGSYAGHLISGLQLQNENKFVIHQGGEYLMWVAVEGVSGGVLRGRILRARSLEECWDRS
jgi:hypothetical protein